MCEIVPFNVWCVQKVKKKKKKKSTLRTLTVSLQSHSSMYKLSPDLSDQLLPRLFVLRLIGHVYPPFSLLSVRSDTPDYTLPVPAFLPKIHISTATCPPPPPPLKKNSEKRFFHDAQGSVFMAIQGRENFMSRLFCCSECAGPGVLTALIYCSVGRHAQHALTSLQ